MTKPELVKAIKKSELYYNARTYFDSEDLDNMVSDLADDLLAATKPKPNVNPTTEE